jgi:hypothetical protein
MRFLETLGIKEGVSDGNRLGILKIGAWPLSVHEILQLQLEIMLLILLGLAIILLRRQTLPQFININNQVFLLQKLTDKEKRLGMQILKWDILIKLGLLLASNPLIL